MKQALYSFAFRIYCCRMHPHAKYAEIRIRCMRGKVVVLHVRLAEEKGGSLSVNNLYCVCSVTAFLFLGR